MGYVTGVGGAFMFSSDPAKLAAWYREHLGMQFEGSDEGQTFYLTFHSLSVEDVSRQLDTTFAILKAKVPLQSIQGGPEPSDMYGDQPFMLNFRVQDLDATLKHLASKGVRPLKRQDEDYGRFAWIRDGDGNRLELYQRLGGR